MADTPRRSPAGSTPAVRGGSPEPAHGDEPPPGVAVSPPPYRLLDTEAGELYRLLVRSVRDYGIFMLDPMGHVASWNEGAQAIKGYTEKEIIGRHFSTFYPPEDIAWDKPAYELKVAAAEGRFEDEGWRLRKDGTRFWANVVITALRDKTGRLVAFAKVTRDLTERREAELRALADARRVAESELANRAKSDFLAAMSHELRTPLNAIGGYADLLLAGIGGALSEQQREYLQRIRGGQQHLLGIINDILNFTRIEAGQVTYELRPVSLGAVIDRVLPLVEPQSTLKVLTLVRSTDVDARAICDQGKVEQILLNLLSNAVKFTDAGGRIEVSCRPAGERVELAVRDSGVGIEPSKQRAIFEPFVQVGRSLTNPHEGTGLGLAISRDLARAMDGELTVESQPGFGSTFVLALPTA